MSGAQRVDVGHGEARLVVEPEVPRTQVDTVHNQPVPAEQCSDVPLLVPGHGEIPVRLQRRPARHTGEPLVELVRTAGLISNRLDGRTTNGCRGSGTKSGKYERPILHG